MDENVYSISIECGRCGEERIWNEKGITEVLTDEVS
jgi:hypothetical protein